MATGAEGRAWSHDELLDDLAAHLAGPSCLLWKDLQMGPVHSPRPDIYTIKKSFLNPRPRTFEVKASRADFRRDVTAGKWESYLEISDSVTFAVPKGMVSKDELPKRCGLIVRGERGWRTVKAPIPETVTWDRMLDVTLLKLLFDGVEREHQARGYRAREIYWDVRKMAEELGEDVAEAVRDVRVVRGKVEATESHIALLRENHEREIETKVERAMERVAAREDRLRRSLDIGPDDSIDEAISALGESALQDDRIEKLCRELDGAARSATMYATRLRELGERLGRART